MTATTAASDGARRCRPTSRLSPRWLASWAAVNAPTPARVAWARESWPPMPVIRVMDRKMVEKASPALNTLSQVWRDPGQHGDDEGRRGARTRPAG